MRSTFFFFLSSANKDVVNILFASRLQKGNATVRSSSKSHKNEFNFAKQLRFMNGEKVIKSFSWILFEF